MKEILLANLILALPIAFISALVASHRGRRMGRWFLGGLFFGIVALITLFLIKKREPKILEETRDMTAFRNGWYYMNDELSEAKGPLSLEAVKALMNEGSLSEESWLWHPMEKGWTQAYQLDFVMPGMKP